MMGVNCVCVVVAVMMVVNWQLVLMVVNGVLGGVVSGRCWQK